MKRGAHPIRVVFGKELLDNLRDRRAMSTALLVPLLGPLTLVSFFIALQQAEERARTPVVPVVGRENAPALVDWLDHQGLQLEAAPAKPEDAVQRGTADIVLRIPEGFGDALRAGSTATVEVICDPSSQRARPTLDRVEQLLHAYGAQIGSLRLTLRGVEPGLIQAVRVDRIDVSPPDARLALLLGSLPLFLVAGCFFGCSYVAIDLTAGERERGSLEPLLLNPVRPFHLVAAKAAATTAFSLLSVLVTVVSFAVIVPLIPFEEIGLSLRLSPTTLLRFIGLLVPTSFLAAAAQLAIGAASKNTKTAQATLGVILVLPMAPGILVSLFPQQPSFGNMLVPILGESIIALRILRGEAVDALHWCANAGADFVAAAVCVGVTSKLFGARMLNG